MSVVRPKILYVEDHRDIALPELCDAISTLIECSEIARTFNHASVA